MERLIEMKKWIIYISALVLVCVVVRLGYFAYKENDFKENITKYIPGIACWGDSLTFGAGGEGITYPDVLSQNISENIATIPVYNLGVGGESSKQIAARSGVEKIILSQEFDMPEEAVPTEIQLVLEDGTPLNILRQGNAGVEEVSLMGVKGILTIEQNSITDSDYKYYFTRSEKGESRKIAKGQELVPSGAYDYNSDISIIFMGTNGEWVSPEDLIDQYRKMIDHHYEKNKERYLVLGLTTGTKEDRTELENKMEEAFGKRYINLRDYLSTYDLEKIGISPTLEDKNAMENGEVPPSLKSDQIHMNKIGYELIAEKVYERMMELSYFNYKINLK